MIAHPAVLLLSDGFSRYDLFLVTFCMTDDWMRHCFGSPNAPRSSRGPRCDEMSDSEVLTILLVGELCQCQRERAWLRQVRSSYLALFPSLPEDSRFARRAEGVRHLLRYLRQALLSWAGADLESLRLFDSFPLPLCACYRVRQSTAPISGSSFAYNASKRHYYFGLHPGLLVTGSGYIEDIVLAPGYCSDPRLLACYLDEGIEAGQDRSGQVFAMDKGFVCQRLKAWAAQHLGLDLAARQRDYGRRKGEEPPFSQQLIDKVRKPIECIISVLTECFGIEHLLVKSDIGIYRRTQAKATAFSLARYFNQVLGLDPMNIARYAV